MGSLEGKLRAQCITDAQGWQIGFGEYPRKPLSIPSPLPSRHNQPHQRPPVPIHFRIAHGWNHRDVDPFVGQIAAGQGTAFTAWLTAAAPIERSTIRSCPRSAWAIDPARPRTGDAPPRAKSVCRPLKFAKNVLVWAFCDVRSALEMSSFRLEFRRESSEKGNSPRSRGVRGDFQRKISVHQRQKSLLQEGQAFVGIARHKIAR